MSRPSSNNKSPHSVITISHNLIVKKLAVAGSSVVEAGDIQSSSSPSI